MRQTSNTIKIVAFSNIDYLPVTKKWYQRMNAIGYTEHVIAAMDETTYNNLRNKGYRVELVSKYMKSLSSLWSARIHYIYKTLQDGIDIFISDVDSIWNRYIPLTKFSDADIYHSFATVYPGYVYKKWGFTLCGCIGFYHSNVRTIDLLKRMVSTCSKQKNCDDQDVLNRVYSDVLKIMWSWNNMTGISPGNGLTLRVWDPTLVQRKSVSCEGWIMSPGASKTKVSKLIQWEKWGKCPIQKKN